MADSPSSPKSASPATTAAAAAAKRPTLLPQAEHAGKPAMPLGAHQFTLIGSRNRAHLHLLSTTISRNHACIVLTKSGLYVRDLASRAGVILNGRKVKESDLHDGDLMQVGSFKFKFQDPAGSIRLPSTPRPPLAMLEMEGRSLTPLDERTVLIGRRPGCDITLDSPAVSNTHAVIFECDGKRYVRDLGSRTGTQVNGATVHQQALELGDQVTVGGTSFRYIAAEMPQLESTDAGLPLEAELEPTAEPQEDFVPEGLEFEAPEPAPAQASIPLAHPDDDAIPLVDDEPAPAVALHAEHQEADDAAQSPRLESEHSIAGDQLPAEEDIPVVGEDVASDIATAEDLGLDFLGAEPEREQAVTAQPHGARPAGIEFVNDPATAGPIVEPITELSSMGFPLIEPEEAELPVAPTGLIQDREDDVPIEPVATEPSPAEPVAEAPPQSVEREPTATEPEPAPAEAAADAEPEASPIELADETAAPNAGLEPTPEPISDGAPFGMVPPAELPETVTAEPEAATLQVEQAEATAPAIEIEPEPLSEPLAETPTEPPAEAVAAPAADEVALESEAEPVVSATETSGSDSGLTIGEADAAQITEAGAAPSETPAAAEPLLSAEEEQATERQAPAIPLRVEDVDLSAVKFERDTTEAEAAAEADESTAQAAPLLDLDAAPAAEAELPAESADESQVAAPEKARRKGRAKKKPGRGRKKKGDPATEIAMNAAAASAPAEMESEVESSADVSDLPTGEAEVAGDASESAEAVAPAESQRASSAGTAELPVAEAEGTDSAPVERTAAQANEVESATEPVAVAMETEREPVQSETAAESQRLEEHTEPTEDGAAISSIQTLGEEAHEVHSESEGAALAKPQAAETIATIEHDPELAQTEHASVAVEHVPSDPVALASDIAAVEPVTGESTLTAPAEAEPPVELTASVAADEQGAITGAPVETIDQTEPTLESALGLEPGPDDVQPPVAETPETTEPDAPPQAALSDTAFGEAVRDFAGADLGPLVEEAPAAEAPHEAVEPERAPALSEPSPAAPAHETTPGMPTLSPLGGADLPPLELGPELTFGGDEKPVAQAQAEAHEPGLHEPAPDEALQLSDLDDEQETPALSTPDMSEAPLELGGATEIQLDLRGEVGAESSAHPALEFGEAEGLDVELPPIDLRDEGHLELEGAAFAKPQAVEVPTPVVASEPPITEAPNVPDLQPATGEEAPSAEPLIAGAPNVGAEAATATAAPVDPVAPAPAALPAQHPAATPSPLDPFFGMGRDLGSFIGGMPLALNTAAAAAAAPAAATPAASVAVPAAPSAPVATPAASAAPVPAKPAANEPSADLDLDKLFEGEEPLELFDETADQLDKLPESLAPISDVSGALAEPKDGPAPAPARAASGEPTAAPVAPAPSVATPAALRTLTADPASVAPKPAPTNVAIPPFAGPRPSARPGMRAFSGMGGVKPTDVFSQTAFPPLDESAFKPQPIPGAAPAAANPAPGHVPQPVGVGPLVPSGFKKADEPPHRPVERPVAAAHGAEPSRRRPWWKNLRVLLPLLIVLLAAAIIAIIWFFPPKTLVQGTLQIKGTDNSTADIWARHDQVTQVRDAINDPELRTEVLSNLQSRGIAPGFAQDPKSFALLADPSNSPFQDGRLVLKRPLVDPRDPQRMQAIVDVIYLRNRTQAEATPQVRGQADDATKKANDLQNRVTSQQDQVNNLSNDLKVKAGAAAPGLLRNASAAVDSLQKEGRELKKAVDQADAEVRLRHDAWENAQAASQNTVVDPKILQIRQNLASLNAQLSVARVARSGRIDPAKAFDDQVQQVGEELTLIATATAGAKNSPLADYAATARGAATEVHSLLAQEKLDADQIAELRQQLAEHREAQLRQVWAADDTLKGLLEQREAQAHRYSAASDSGYTAEAAQIQGVIEQLERQIEDRRQTLATTGQSSDETQQKLERTIQGLENERQQDEAKIKQAMARLQVPTTGKISLGENAALLDLEKNVVAAQAQYDAYAAALAGKQSTAGDAEAEIHKLEGKIAEQQAQLDAYQQRSDAPAQVAAARQALDAAQEAQAKAQRALADNLDELRVARQYSSAQAKLKEYSDDFSKAQQDAQGTLAQAAAVPIVLRPDPQTAVQVVREEDQRVTYLVVAIGLIVALFAIPLWLAAREPEADVPYAHLMAEPREAFGQRGEDLQGEEILPDEEHAALT
jgi:pSer/pThr/pTyr-binding forkhead associated (FHA) protein